MKKIKILHISPDGVLYGTERHILSILKYSNPDFFHHVVAVPREGSFTEKIKALGIKFVVCGRQPNKKHRWQGMSGSNGLGSLVKLLRIEKFDIIHSHLNSYGAFAAKIFTSAKVFHTRHGVFWSEEDLAALSFRDKFFQKLKSRMFDITIAIGEYERDTLVNILGYNKNKIRLTFNGINTDEIGLKVNENIAKSELFHTDNIVIGAVGRLERQKGFHIFIDAASRVLKKSSNVKFVIIGDGSLKDQLQLQCKNLGIESHFDLISYKDNIFDYISKFDIMVQTSLWEGISYSVLEPMALKKPVVALSSQNTNGVKEIIVDNQTGFLIFDNFADKIADRLLLLINDPDKIINMGIAGYERVKHDFTEERTCYDMEKYYKESVSL